MEGTDIYNYLRGIWRDNVPMTLEVMGMGRSGSTTDECNFMFPGTSDQIFQDKNGQNKLLEIFLLIEDSYNQQVHLLYNLVL